MYLWCWRGKMRWCAVCNRHHSSCATWVCECWSECLSTWENGNAFSLKSMSVQFTLDIYLSEKVFWCFSLWVTRLSSVGARLRLDLVCIERSRESQRASGINRSWLLVLPSWVIQSSWPCWWGDSKHSALCWEEYHNMHPEQVWVEVEVKSATVSSILVDLLHFPCSGLLLPRAFGFAPPILGEWVSYWDVNS